MNKQEWLESIDISKMLEQITDDRKLRLLACAAVRQFWHLLEDDRLKNAVIVAEKFADGLATEQELQEQEFKVAEFVALATAYSDARSVAKAAWATAWYTAKYAASSAVCSVNTTKQYKCNLLREIVNPYHITTIYPKISQEIAQNIYKTQDFTGTGILADSLEEHGIMDQELLDHLRTHTHVRGCWAIDAIRTAKGINVT